MSIASTALLIGPRRVLADAMDAVRQTKRAARWGRDLTTQKGCHRGGADTTMTGHAGRGRYLRAARFIVCGDGDLDKRFVVNHTTLDIIQCLLAPAQTTRCRKLRNGHSTTLRSLQNIVRVLRVGSRSPISKTSPSMTILSTCSRLGWSKAERRSSTCSWISVMRRSFMSGRVSLL